VKSKIQTAGKFVLHNLEAFIWITAIVGFAFSPVHTGEHFTLCPLKLAGFEHCPGCGLGRSLILLLHGHVAESISMHPLAIFALSVLLARIVIVFRNNFQFERQMTASLLHESEFQSQGTINQTSRFS
jgi:hypothetical protein